MLNVLKLLIIIERVILNNKQQHSVKKQKKKIIPQQLNMPHLSRMPFTCQRKQRYFLNAIERLIMPMLADIE